MMELKIEGSNPAPQPFSTIWINNLIKHLKNKASECSSQTEYADIIDVHPAYVSSIIRGKWENLGRNTVMKVAVASGFEKSYIKVPRKPRNEKAVEFENTQDRERYRDPAPSKDLQIINEYMEKRREAVGMPKYIQAEFIHFLLQGTIKELDSVTSDQINA